MDYIVNTFTYELEHGGPHVHFLAFILSFPARRLPPLRWGMNGGA